MDLATRKVSSVPDEIVAPFESEKIKRIKRYPKINSPEKDIFYLIGFGFMISTAISTSTMQCILIGCWMF